MPNTDREVFAYFRRDEDTSPEVDALAYAADAFDKYEWMTKVEKRDGKVPAGAEIDRWISELPDSRLDEIQQNALAFFRKTVSTYVEEAEERAFRAGQQDAIVRQVERATSFWRNLPGNLTVGIVSSFVFALLLVLASVVFNKDPSPIALYEKLAAPAATTPAK
jgi:hypothetical protein